MYHQYIQLTVILQICSFALTDRGVPLKLTPLIKSGNIEKAKHDSKVGKLKDGIDVESYSGYLTVDDEYDSNLFFWYFPSEEPPTSNTSVLLWLSGGPGFASMTTMFIENGPYVINKDNELERRDIYWSKKYHVLYIDNPVGTGFSYTESEDGYCRNETHVGKNLYEAMIQFFTLFSELQDNPFFITGESYAGKYIPALAYTIHVNNPDSNLKINLQGLVIEGGMCDPERMMLYGDYLYQFGVIDHFGKKYFHKKEAEIRNLIKQEKYEDAYWVWDSLIRNDKSSYLHNESGYSYHLHILHNIPDPNDKRHVKFLQQDYVSEALHVGDRDFNATSSIVRKHLINDIMQTVRPWIEMLLEHYRVIFYNGQLDIIVPYPSTESFLWHLDWSGAKDYKMAKRHKWYVKEELAGYVKTVGNFYEILVRNSGHLSTKNQPSWGMDLITKFVENLPYY